MTSNIMPLSNGVAITLHTLKVCPSSFHRASNTSLKRIDVFRFTLYWMLIFLSPFFLITGGIASFNIIYPPRHDYKNGISSTRSRTLQPVPDSHSAIPLTPLTSARSPDLLLPEVPEVVDTEERRAPQPRKNVRRSRITYALFTLLSFLVTVLAASFFWSAVIGYVLWALFRTGDFNIST